MVLLGSVAVSTLGSSLSLLAVLVHLRPLGAGWVSASFAAEVVPSVVLAPLAGAAVDAVSNRRLLAGALVLQAVAMAAAAAFGLAPGRAGVLLAALVAVGAGWAVAVPAVAALLPAVTGEGGATRAYGWYAALRQAGFVAGFAVAGVLVGATSVATAISIDAASYAVMAVAVTALRADRVPGDRSVGGAAGRDRERVAWLRGFAVLAGDRVLLVATLGLAAAVLASVVVNIAEVFFVLGPVGASTTTYGVVTACWPAAGVAAGWAAGRLVGDRALAAALGAAAVVMGVGLVVAAASVAVWGVLVGWTLGGAANAVQNVAHNALVQSRVAERERGRVFAAASALLQTANVAGLGVGAAVVAAVGARASLLGAGVASCCVGALAWAAARSPAVRARIAQ